MRLSAPLWQGTKTWPSPTACQTTGIQTDCWNSKGQEQRRCECNCSRKRGKRGKDLSHFYGFAFLMGQWRTKNISNKCNKGILEHHMSSKDFAHSRFKALKALDSPRILKLRKAAQQQVSDSLTGDTGISSDQDRVTGS